MLTNDKVLKIIEMWNSGMSSKEIAAYFGVTKNVIIGKVHRARMAGHEIKVKNKGFGIPKKKTLTTRKKPAPVLPVPIKTAKLIPFHFVPKTVVPGRIEIQDLGPKQCKYPVKMSSEGKHMFCGEEQQEKSPYCPKHHKACYQKETKPIHVRPSSHKVRIYGR
jgi:GcrA cell cycle regulator